MWTWIKHNTALTIGLVVCIALGIYGYGCQSTAPSVLHPGEKVTVNELQLEAKQILNQYEVDTSMIELSLVEIERQDTIKQRIFNFFAAAAEAGTINPLGILGLAGYVLGTTSYINGRKKDTVIARDKTLMAGSTK